MDRKSILLIAHGYFEKDFLHAIAGEVKREYELPVQIDENYRDLNEFYDPARRQYDGSRLLKFLDSTAPKDMLKTIGLFSVDLFIPVLTYIFGQAIYRGSTGIASVYRLKNEPYGMTVNTRLMQERFQKLVIHELGHTFGLVHCYDPVCVMRSSTYVEDIDQKKSSLCVKCRELINQEGK